MFVAILSLTFLLVTFLFIEICLGNHLNDRHHSTKRSIEKSLIADLMQKYELSGNIGRPVKNAQEQITVKFGLSLIQILDLDENKQILRTNCWLRYHWTDDMLNWKDFNNSEFNTIEEIRVYPDQIWTPDIKLYNFADERLLEHREARVVVHQNGHVMWVPQAIFKSTCPVEITYFPFDSQICELNFGSWTYDKSQIFLNWTDVGEYIDLNDYLPSNEWFTNGEEDKNKSPGEIKKQIKSEKYTTNLTTITTDDKFEVREYEILKFKVRITRNPKFHVSILILPCILLSCLTLISFWLPPESSAKMMLGMNIFVAFFVLLLLLAESTPSAVKNFPLIGSYYCLNMILITLSTFLSVSVINLYFRGDRKGPVPPQLRRIIIEGMGRLLLIRQNIPLPNENELLRRVIVGDHKAMMRKIGHTSHERSNANRLCEHYDLSSTQTFHSTSNNSRIEKEVREIKRYIQMYVSRQKDRECRNLLAMEWRTLALVIDRTFFVIYLVAILIALITILPRPQ